MTTQAQVKKRDWTLHPKAATTQPLVPIKHTLSELTGPVFGHNTVKKMESDRNLALMKLESDLTEMESEQKKLESEAQFISQQAQLAQMKAEAERTKAQQLKTDGNAELEDEMAEWLGEHRG